MRGKVDLKCVNSKKFKIFACLSGLQVHMQLSSVRKHCSGHESTLVQSPRFLSLDWEKEKLLSYKQHTTVVF